MSEMQWQTLPLGQLRPAAYNPRKALKPSDKEYQKIKNSIQEFGYVEWYIHRSLCQTLWRNC